MSRNVSATRTLVLALRTALDCVGDLDPDAGSEDAVQVLQEQLPVLLEHGRRHLEWSLESGKGETVAVPAALYEQVKGILEGASHLEGPYMLAGAACANVLAELKASETAT